MNLVKENNLTYKFCSYVLKIIGKLIFDLSDFFLQKKKLYLHFIEYVSKNPKVNYILIY